MSWLAFGPVGWLLVGVGFLAVFLLTFLIEAKKDNKLQEWLARCHFGTGTEKYSDAETQEAQHKRAIA